MTDEQKNTLTLFKIVQKKLKEQGFKQGITTPGFMTEYAAAAILNHELHTTKHGPDATDKDNSEITYEYLSANEGNSFQIDRIDETNINRITRNEAFYMIVKDKDPVEINEIYRVETDKVLKRSRELIETMKKTSRHININLKWVKDNGELVYTKSNEVSDLSIDEFIGSRKL